MLTDQWVEASKKDFFKNTTYSRGVARQPVYGHRVYFAGIAGSMSQCACVSKYLLTSLPFTG